MGIDEGLVHEIVRRVLSVAKPERIILFGSAATGRMTRDSDIDLLVLEPAPENRLKESVKIRRALAELDYPFDVIVMRTERFEETKGIIGGLAFPVNKYGLVIYEAA
jgi:predicted nucleotidyltransferase